jgi:hypothetical protein
MLVRCLNKRKSSAHFSISSNWKTTAFWDIASCSLVEEIRHASIISTKEHGSSPRWLRQYAPLKHRSTLTRLRCAITQKVVVFILAAVRTDISHRRVLLFTINARPWSTTSVRSIGFRKETFTLEIVMTDEYLLYKWFTVKTSIGLICYITMTNL